MGTAGELGIPAHSQEITFTQLIRLRWLAIFGQAAAVATAAIAGIDLPLGLLFTFIALMAVSNLLVDSSKWSDQARGTSQLALVIVSDVILLTAILYWSGGVHNPFTSFYLLQLVVAALTLDSRLAWGITALCVSGFSVLFLSPHPLLMPHTQVGQISFNLHMQGMFIAFGLTGAFVTYFVTKLRRALKSSEEELVRSRDQAQHAERLASLATLAAGVAHELATPLATISVISQELESGAPESISRFSADSRLIRSQVERCQAILSKLNGASTDGIGETPQQIGLGQLLADMINSLPPEQSGRLRLDNGVGELMLFVPKESVIQAIATLIKNACEAESSGAPVTLCVATQDKSICFTVCDRGSGISPEIISRLGEPFFTTKDPGRGMGLGLFLVRTLAERLGGSLEVESPPQGGSQFTFRVKL